MSNLLVLSALGHDKPGLVTELSNTILSYGCNIVDSRMTVLGGEFAIIMLISGSWNNIAKFEDSLQGLQETLQLAVTCTRTDNRKLEKDALPYSVEVIALDHQGIVHELAGFFSSRNINIYELYTGSYNAAHTGTPMFTLNMILEIPAKTQIAVLRDDFLEYCDQLNLDAVIEPIKS
jgi:glycine cleavage system transcriptional repressor